MIAVFIVAAHGRLEALTFFFSSSTVEGPATRSE